LKERDLNGVIPAKTLQTTGYIVSFRGKRRDITP
jgi:hypothetical protein